MARSIKSSDLYQGLHGCTQDIPSLHSESQKRDCSVYQRFSARGTPPKVCLCSFPFCKGESINSIVECLFRFQFDRSAGASLRRYNEAALEQEIRDLIGSWTEHVKEASCIFIRTPKYSRGSLIGDRGTKAPFTRGDPRLRVLPFPTRRPTLKEVQAVHKKLATIYIGLVKGDQNHREEDQPTKQRGEGEEEGLHQSGGVREDEGGDEGEMTLVIDRKEDTVVSDSEKDTKKKKKGRKKDKGLQEDKDQQLLGDQ